MITKVFLICSGLGKVRRGFESFTQECFDALAEDPSLDMTLFKGGGKSGDKTIPLWNFPRDSAIAKLLGKLSNRGDYFIEQLSFVSSLLPYIQLHKPDVIYFSDGVVGNALWHWRRITHQSYKLLFSNGGPLLPPFHRWDHVQQVTPYHYNLAIAAGEPSQTQSLVPYGLNISATLEYCSIEQQNQLRRQLQLPENRPILLSVGAINSSHKRMDYLIYEVASLPEPRPFLLLLGQQERESQAILSLGKELLGATNFAARTVVRSAMADYYKVADAFILASLDEGFGRVLMEAMSYGLPCLAHDYDVTRFVLGELGYLADLKVPGNLSGLINQVLEKGDSEDQRKARHRTVRDRFSWETLRPAYVDMIHKCAGQPMPAPGIFVSQNP
jgi:glycosyltransferase involved in cell wall biosynthesis